MTSVPGGKCTLNPDAPPFIPAAFRQVEDFSPEWWELIKTSAWFHDYWNAQHREEDYIEDATDLGIDDLDAELEELAQYSKSNETNESADHTLPVDKTQSDPEMDIETLLRNQSLANSSKERGSKSPLASPRYMEKPAKCISPKYSPRRIQQPRGN